MKLKERASKLKHDIPAVFLALRDKRTPFSARLVACVTLIYALSPIDLIPDFIPVLGYIDDLVILPALIVLTVRLIPAELFNEYRKLSEGMWKDGKPKRWYYALPFVFIWLVIILVILKLILN